MQTAGRPEWGSPFFDFYQRLPTRQFYALRLQHGGCTGASGPFLAAELRHLNLFSLDYDADPKLLAWVRSEERQFDLAY